MKEDLEKKVWDVFVWLGIHESILNKFLLILIRFVKKIEEKIPSIVVNVQESKCIFRIYLGVDSK